jgi:hypothetical protein
MDTLSLSAVSVAVKLPAVVGVPQITPTLDMVSPGGKPVAENIAVGVVLTW